MGKVTLIDKSPQFIRENEAVIDREFGIAAIDIERLSKMQVPQETSRLQNTGYHERVGPMKYRLNYNTPYARRWHFETPPNGFKNGRKSHYLSDPATTIKDQLIGRLQAALGGINV